MRPDPRITPIVIYTLLSAWFQDTVCTTIKIQIYYFYHGLRLPLLLFLRIAPVFWICILARVLHQRPHFNPRVSNVDPGMRPILNRVPIELRADVPCLPVNNNPKIPSYVPTIWFLRCVVSCSHAKCAWSLYPLPLSALFRTKQHCAYLYVFMQIFGPTYCAYLCVIVHIQNTHSALYRRKIHKYAHIQKTSRCILSSQEHRLLEW